MLEEIDDLLWRERHVEPSDAVRRQCDFVVALNCICADETRSSFSRKKQFFFSFVMQKGKKSNRRVVLEQVAAVRRTNLLRQLNLFGRVGQIVQHLQWQIE